MRFAIKIAPQHTTWPTMLDVFKEADRIDLFESGWNFDHFYPLSGNHAGPCLEGWTTLTALAQATSRIRLGCLVTGITYRHPAVLANMAAAVDIISAGRLELGIGAGWNEEESDAYGISLGTPAERSDRFEEACAVLVGLLTREMTTLDGTYYQLKDARCEPKGPQQPHPPICIGGSGEKRTLRTTARYALTAATRDSARCSAVPKSAKARLGAGHRSGTGPVLAIRRCAQHSNTDQQMSFRNRWSSRTRSLIAAGSWSRCHWHSSRAAVPASPSGTAARAALIP
jgi:F420-dependent oxidoreductase-like protein